MLNSRVVESDVICSVLCFPRSFARFFVRSFNSSFPSRPLIQSTSRVHEKRGSHLSATPGVTKRGKSKKTGCPAIVVIFFSSGSEGDILVPYEDIIFIQAYVIYIL